MGRASGGLREETHTILASPHLRGAALAVPPPVVAVSELRLLPLLMWLKLETVKIVYFYMLIPIFFLLLLISAFISRILRGWCGEGLYLEAVETCHSSTGHHAHTTINIATRVQRAGHKRKAVKFEKDVLVEDVSVLQAELEKAWAESKIIQDPTENRDVSAKKTKRIG